MSMNGARSLASRVMSRVDTTDHQSWVGDAVARFEGPLTLYASRLLRDHLIIYGLGGIVAPFVGIKAIDLLLVVLHLA